MTAMRTALVEQFTRHDRGNFAIAASLVAVPVIMGLALAIDFSRIDHATRSASTALIESVRSSLSPDGELDADRALQLYADELRLPKGQQSSSPKFRQLPDGAWSARVTTTTQLTLGGIVLPKIYYRPVTVTVRRDKLELR